MKQWLRTAMLALMTGLLVACGGGTDDPANVAETFFKELLQGDTAKAVDLIYLPPEAQQNGMSEKDVKDKLTLMFSSAKAKLDKQGGIDSIKAGNVSYTNSDKTEATVEITIKLKNGAENKDTIAVIKTDKGWKVNME